jgi:ABC-type glycerol-3-phosphate transport system substrate-binding protein
MCSGASESPLKRLMPFAYGGGGDVVDSSQPEMPSFDAPLYAMTLEMLTTLRQVSVLASEDSLELLFVKGHLGLLLAGSELATRIAREAPTLRYGMGLVPGNNPGDGRHISVAGGEVLVSLTESRRKEDALKLARYLVRPENAHALATALQIVQPANLGADTTAWYRARPEQQLMFRQYETARFLPYFRGRIALEDTLTTLIDDALDGRRSAAEAVALADSFIAKHVGPR